VNREAWATPTPFLFASPDEVFIDKSRATTKKVRKRV